MMSSQLECPKPSSTLGSWNLEPSADPATVTALSRRSLGTVLSEGRREAWITIGMASLCHLDTAGWTSTPPFLPLSSSVSRHQTGNVSLTGGFGNAERRWQSQGWQVRDWGPGPTCLLSALPLPAEHTSVSQAGRCSVRDKTRNCDPEVTGLGLRPLWPQN